MKKDKRNKLGKKKQPPRVEKIKHKKPFLNKEIYESSNFCWDKTWNSWEEGLYTIFKRKRK